MGKWYEFVSSSIFTWTHPSSIFTWTHVWIPVLSLIGRGFVSRLSSACRYIFVISFRAFAESMSPVSGLMGRLLSSELEVPASVSTRSEEPAVPEPAPSSTAVRGQGKGKGKRRQ